MKTLRAMIYKRPWLLVVFFLGMMMMLALTFVMIAVMNPPDLI